MGTTPLRKAIARHYGERYNLDIAPSRVVVTAGASAALSLACCALVNPGEHVLMTDPCYPCNRHFVAAYDGIPDLVPVGPQTRFQMTRALLEQHRTPATVGVLLASPSNPTGTSIAHEELGAIIAAARARAGFSIVDEIYLGLRYGDADGPPETRSALEFGDDVIVTNSFSKYFSMTGWRLGWLIVPETLAATFEKLAQNLYICASTLAQHAAIACFEPESMAIFEERRRAFRLRRDFIVPALRDAGLDVPVTPDGAFYVYCDCSRHSDDSAKLALELLDEAFVATVPGTDFGFHAPERYLRLSYATSLEQLEEAAARLKRHFAGR